MTIYETPTVAHAQYIASTERGRKLGALDLLVNWLINQHYHKKLFFDFGCSNEQEGRALNHGLLEWKEGFGARACALDFYEVPTANFSRLEPILAVPQPALHDAFYEEPAPPRGHYAASEQMAGPIPDRNGL